MKKDQSKKKIGVNFENSYLFLSYIVTNTQHTIASLSEILDIPKKRLNAINKFTKQDHKKVDELRKMLMQ